MLCRKTKYAQSKYQKQFDIAENRIEEANCQVYFCHPSKILVAIKKGIMNFRNLRYLIIDEADDLLRKDG